MVAQESALVIAADLDVSSCGECGSSGGKAHRVENGQRYCGTCYARCFKRSLCTGCGMFSRLLISDPNAKCRKCVAGAPCVRCERAGRPLGLLTELGPVCNSCYPYFREEHTCATCGLGSRRLSRVETDTGPKLICQRCATAHHRTCAQCRRHRLCSEKASGEWVCKKCDALGEVACGECSSPMPAGRGARCDKCYWHARCQSVGDQHLELLSTPRAREGFAAYLEWAMAEVDHTRLTRALPRHVEFFEMLETLGEAPWTVDALLREFGTATLRKYELPMRWMSATQGVELSAEAKAQRAETDRSLALVEMAAAGSVGREIMLAFHARLSARVAAGVMRPKSMRLALRPAIAVLQIADPNWQSVPDQAALEKYLAETPGQRAACSTFLGFLKETRGVELTARAEKSPADSRRHKTLGEQLAALAREPLRADDFEQRWLLLALKYFQQLTDAKASKVLKQARVVRVDDGFEVKFEGQIFWIPDAPKVPWESTHG